MPHAPAVTSSYDEWTTGVMVSAGRPSRYLLLQRVDNSGMMASAGRPSRYHLFRIDSIYDDEDKAA